MPAENNSAVYSAKARTASSWLWLAVVVFSTAKAFGCNNGSFLFCFAVDRLHPNLLPLSVFAKFTDWLGWLIGFRGGGGIPCSYRIALPACVCVVVASFPPKKTPRFSHSKINDQCQNQSCRTQKWPKFQQKWPHLSDSLTHNVTVIYRIKYFGRCRGEIMFVTPVAHFFCPKGSFRQRAGGSKIPMERERPNRFKMLPSSMIYSKRNLQNHHGCSNAPIPMEPAMPS